MLVTDFNLPHCKASIIKQDIYLLFTQILFLQISISIQLQLSDQQQQIQRIQRLIHTDTSELLSNINTFYKI